MWNTPEDMECRERQVGEAKWFCRGVTSKGYGFVGWWDFTHTFIPVLDKTGRIHIYNTKEQSLSPAGYLPVPQSSFELGQQNEVANPRNVLAYEIVPVYAIKRLPAEPNKPPESFDVKYLGMNVACISREGTAMAVAVFDPNGRMIYRGDTRCNGISTAECILCHSDATTILLSS